MRRLLAIIALIATPAWAQGISTEKELFSAAEKADFVGCLSIRAYPTPRAEVMSAWKPVDSAPLAGPIRRTINAYVLAHPATVPEKGEQMFLLLCGSPTGLANGVPASFSEVHLIPMESHRALLQDGEITVDVVDLRKAIHKQQDASRKKAN